MQKSQTQRPTQTKWLEVPQNLKLGVPFIKGTVLRPVGADIVQYEAITERGPIKIEVSNSATFLMSNGQMYDDMCNMDILNEPEILNNLIERYKSSKIFTFIGPTLIVINPYRVINEYFSNEAMLRIRDKILNGTTSTQKPHIYLIAGNAYISMIDRKKKQAIVISGQSGAGKTQSTKYCMQILTSLSHKQSLPIEAKILACNPILQAFGNSKTIRNDNSSRFGKYVQIYFAQDNTIAGASINSYLLQKSRVVAAAQKQRTFHVFYSLIASQMFGLQKPSYYSYLSKSKCYEAAGIDDKKYFDQIKKSMKSIGFTNEEENKIWVLLITILQLGNIQFQDTAHKQHQSNPCVIKDKKQMEKIAKNLSIKEADLQKILLFEKKKFLKQITLSPYNKNKCIANVNTLSKAIYNAIFEFIIFKIYTSLKPVKNLQNYIPINILDIFGFQNFQHNSFEQFCINFTNQKLLKLYNKYVFQRQMDILKQDGLMDQVSNIKAPANDYVIQIISGKLSMFSIINDFTMPQQFKDSDIIQGFQNKLSKCSVLKFDKIHKNHFVIIHSQCQVKYSIEGFKQKNQDKVIPQIADIVNNLFLHQSKQLSGKTLLSKFSTQIDDLMNQLDTSCVHFIRCIKPNQKKMPNYTESQYIVNQIRYLGVFQTIQIRKQTFPSRWLYQQFVDKFQTLFKITVGNAKTKTQKIMKQLTDKKQTYLMGDNRVYMNSQLQRKLSNRLHQNLKKKFEAAKKILKCYKNFKFKRTVKANLKTLVKRKKLWIKIITAEAIKIYKQGFKNLKLYAEYKKQQQKILMNKKLMQAKLKREQEEKRFKQFNNTKKNQNQSRCCELILVKRLLILKRNFFNKLKSLPKQISENEAPNKKSVYDSVKVNNEKIFNNLNDSQLNQSIVIFQQSRGVYQREISNNPLKIQHKKSFEFNESFLNQKTFIANDNKDVLLPSSLNVPLFSNQTSPMSNRLITVLSQKYQIHYTGSQQEFFSPSSEDSNFQLADASEQIINKVINFNAKQFFKKVLRRRTNFIGMQKDEDDILVCKGRPLSKSLTQISEQDDKIAIKVFKHLLKVVEESKLDHVFKLIQIYVGDCQNTSPELKNQVFLQLIKQSNTPAQMPSVRVIQAMAVFLHIFTPDKDFLYAGLNFFFKKLAQEQYTDKQNEYVRYIFKKIIRKLQKPYSMSYMPIKYQLMALMCKRKISIPAYLPIGSSVMIRVESSETFGEIKIRALEQLGVNTKRLDPQLFTVWEIINFDNIELEENPIYQKQSVWDTITYWEKAKDKYKEKGISPPIFFTMVKLRYIYQCSYDDEETVSLLFAQAYFQYFIGRMILTNLKQMGLLAGIVKKIKFQKRAADDYKGSYPNWVYKKYSQNELINSMVQNVNLIQQQNLKIHDLKYMFVSIASKSPTCLSYSLPMAQGRICFRPNKIMLVNNKNELTKQFSIKQITKFSSEGKNFTFSTKNNTEKQIIQTNYSDLCVNYLQRLPILIAKSKQNSKIIMNHLAD